VRLKEAFPLSVLSGEKGEGRLVWRLRHHGRRRSRLGEKTRTALFGKKRGKGTPLSLRTMGTKHWEHRPSLRAFSKRGKEKDDGRCSARTPAAKEGGYRKGGRDLVASHYRSLRHLSNKKKRRGEDTSCSPKREKLRPPRAKSLIHFLSQRAEGKEGKEKKESESAYRRPSSFSLRGGKKEGPLQHGNRSEPFREEAGRIHRERGKKSRRFTPTERSTGGKPHRHPLLLIEEKRKPLSRRGQTCKGRPPFAFNRRLQSGEKRTISISGKKGRNYAL